MDFSAGVHDVICTRKINIDRVFSRGQYLSMSLAHITSCSPAEKSIDVLLYNQSALKSFCNFSSLSGICVLLVIEHKLCK